MSINSEFYDGMSVGPLTNGNMTYILDQRSVEFFLKGVNESDWDIISASTIYQDRSQYITSLRIYPFDFLADSQNNIWGLRRNSETGDLEQYQVRIASFDVEVDLDAKTHPVKGYLKDTTQFFLSECYYDLSPDDPVNIDEIPNWLQWAKYSPYASAKIYIPMSQGYHDIDINSIMNRKLRLKYVVDLTSGMCNVYVLSYDVSMDELTERLELSTSFKIGVDCPTSTDTRSLAERINAYNGIKSVLTDWYSGLMNGYGGGWMGMSAGVVSAVGNTSDKIIQNPPKLSKGGSNDGTWLQTYMSFEPHILIAYKNPSITDSATYAHTVGYRVFKPVNTLSGTYGYTVLESVHLPEYQGMLSEEAEEIERLLTTGVILPPPPGQ